MSVPRWRIYKSKITGQWKAYRPGLASESFQTWEEALEFVLCYRRPNAY